MLELCLPIITARALNPPILLPLKQVSEGRLYLFITCLDLHLLKMDMPSSYFIYLNPIVSCILHIHEENTSLSTLQGGAV